MPANGVTVAPPVRTVLDYRGVGASKRTTQGFKISAAKKSKTTVDRTLHRIPSGTRLLNGRRPGFGCSSLVTTAHDREEKRRRVHSGSPAYVPFFFVRSDQPASLLACLLACPFPFFPSAYPGPPARRAHRKRNFPPAGHSVVHVGGGKAALGPQRTTIDAGKESESSLVLFRYCRSLAPFADGSISTARTERVMHE
jgi:hypothetical protein